MQHAAMTEVKRFDFLSLRDFSTPPGDDADLASAEEEIVEEEALPPPPPPPVFSEKELEHAKAQALEEGYKKGLEEGSLRTKKADAEREAQLFNMLKLACEKITAFRDEYERHVTEQQEALTRLATAVARHVAGDAMKSSPEIPVSRMIGECLPMLLGEPRVVITLHPSIIPLMKEKLEDVGKQAGYEGTLILDPDEKLNPSDCHIQWQGGSAYSSTEEMWQTIEQKLIQLPPAPEL